MRGLPKLLSPDGQRTRLHTYRGELLPAGAWRDIPTAVLQRVLKRDLTGPWMMPGAVRFLDRHIQPQFEVLELGSGASTVWFAARSRRVVSYETDGTWLERTATTIAEGGVMDRVELRSVPLRDLPGSVRRIIDRFDLVIVDSDFDGETGRRELVIASAPLVRAGGYLVLDDSDRPMFDMDLPEELWERHRFPGIKSFPLHATETTVWRRRVLEDDAPTA